MGVNFTEKGGAATASQIIQYVFCTTRLAFMCLPFGRPGAVAGAAGIPSWLVCRLAFFGAASGVQASAYATATAAKGMELFSNVSYISVGTPTRPIDMKAKPEKILRITYHALV